MQLAISYGIRGIKHMDMLLLENNQLQPSHRAASHYPVIDYFSITAHQNQYVFFSTYFIHISDWNTSHQNHKPQIEFDSSYSSSS